MKRVNCCYVLQAISIKSERIPFPRSATICSHSDIGTIFFVLYVYSKRKNASIAFNEMNEFLW